MFEMLANIAVGVFAGVSSALVGYFRKTPVQKFDLKKLMKTVVIGAIVGGAYAYNPIYTGDVVVTFLEDFGYVTIIDRFVDLVYARLKALYKKYKGE